jgi:F0F1-type ATP synthase assembly protein I
MHLGHELVSVVLVAISFVAVVGPEQMLDALQGRQSAALPQRRF